MIKNILVCTDGSNYGDTACAYGIHLAGLLKARLRGLHVLDSRMLEGPLLADISGWIGADPYRALQPQFRELMQKKGEAVAEAFRDQCRKQGLPADCKILTGHPARAILEEESVAELVVMGQRGEHAGWIREMTGSTVERVVRLSVKPCLVTPTEFKPVTRILTAYDGSSHAGQALHVAIELAQALRLPLILLTVVDGEHPERAEQNSRDALHLAEAHEVKTTSIVKGGKPVEVILHTAQEQDCDLIVVGAYGHSRIREMILGSTTASLISKSARPIMMVR